MAQTGGLDGTLLSQGQFYNTNYTKPLLFIADGTYLANLAGAAAPAGDAVGHDERDRATTPARPGSGCTRCGTRSHR